MYKSVHMHVMYMYVFMSSRGANQNESLHFAMSNPPPTFVLLLIDNKLLVSIIDYLLGSSTWLKQAPNWAM